jgi:hypothetical protein
MPGARVPATHHVGAAQLQAATGGRLDQRHHAGQRGFAATRFADHRQGFARLDGERNTADGLQQIGLAEKPLLMG